MRWIKSPIARLPLRFAATALIGVVALFNGGCGAERKQEIAPQKIEGNSELSRGQRVFMHACNQCHPGGAAGLGPAINNKPLPGAMIKLQVRKGLGAMPHFSQDHINDADLDAIVKYLQARRQQPALAQS
jgi:mono/diheme cytochrome c family protein